MAARCASSSLSGEGNTDSAVTILGLFVGAAFAHNFGLAASGDGPTVNGMIAVVIIVVVCRYRPHQPQDRKGSSHEDHRRTGAFVPEPVVLTRNAVKENPEGVIVLVDAVAARENVTRFGKSQGYDVAVEDTEDGWKLTLTKA